MFYDVLVEDDATSDTSLIIDKTSTVPAVAIDDQSICGVLSHYDTVLYHRPMLSWMKIRSHLVSRFILALPSRVRSLGDDVDSPRPASLCSPEDFPEAKNFVMDTKYQQIIFQTCLCQALNTNISTRLAIPCLRNLQPLHFLFSRKLQLPTGQLPQAGTRLPAQAPHLTPPWINSGS